MKNQNFTSTFSADQSPEEIVRAQDQRSSSIASGLPLKCSRSATFFSLA
jgi:hypothetical protein